MNHEALRNADRRDQPSAGEGEVVDQNSEEKQNGLEGKEEIGRENRELHS
jgi:hypothetical protein